MAHESVIFYNGNFMDTTSEKASFPIEERGFQFGDGIYEVIRLYDGQFYTMEEHMIRLYRSLHEVRITIPWTQEELTHLLEELVAKNNFSSDGQVYLQITRGSAPRNHVFPENTTPNVVAYVKEAARPHGTMSNGVATYLADDIRWLRCDIKSLNLLPSVLAKQTAKEKGGYEAIFHRNGTVTECSSSNVYLVKDGVIYTHPTTNLILNGITRQRVVAICKEQGVPLVEKAFSVEDIFSADELFLTSTTSEVTPIVSVDDVAIGNGSVGSITKQLQKWYEIDANIHERVKR